MTSVDAVFSFTNHTKWLNPLPTSPASHVVFTAGCLLVQGPLEHHPRTCGSLKSHRNELQQNSTGNLHHQYLAELLLNVYSYYVMVKSLFCCYVYTCILKPAFVKSSHTFFIGHTTELMKGSYIIM